MYGSYGLYSGNRSNFSSSANLYKPAGVVNISSSYISAGNNPNNINTNGVKTSNSTISNTSVIVEIINPGSFQTNTNVLIKEINLSVNVIKNPYSLLFLPYADVFGSVFCFSAVLLGIISVLHI